MAEMFKVNPQSVMVGNMLITFKVASERGELSHAIMSIEEGGRMYRLRFAPGGHLIRVDKDMPIKQGGATIGRAVATEAMIVESGTLDLTRDEYKAIEKKE